MECVSNNLTHIVSYCVLFLMIIATHCDRKASAENICTKQELSVV